MSSDSLIKQLIQAFRILPGVGPRSAQRMAFYLLQRKRHEGLILAETLGQALVRVTNCKRCRNFSDGELCSTCANPKRDTSLLCIVESPTDIFAIEQTCSYRGLYFTLMGHLSPIDGIGPNEIGMGELTNLLKTESEILQEVIIATNPTVEGEATAHYIANLIHGGNVQVKCTRIAHGIPFGGELEYIDGGTLAQAIARRTEI